MSIKTAPSPSQQKVQRLALLLVFVVIVVLIFNLYFMVNDNSSTQLAPSPQPAPQSAFTQEVYDQVAQMNIGPSQITGLATFFTTQIRDLEANDPAQWHDNLSFSQHTNNLDNPDNYSWDALTQVQLLDYSFNQVESPEGDSIYVELHAQVQLTNAQASTAIADTIWTYELNCINYASNCGIIDLVFVQTQIQTESP